MLPTFRYHPDPIATGSVKQSDKECRSCGQARGYIYTASVYAQDDLDEQICPWCIADGSAAEKFDATFSDANPLASAGISGDACEFHGDAQRPDLKALKGDDLETILDDLGMERDEWKDFVKEYEAPSDPAIYKFICRHCKRIKYGWDCS